MNHVKAIAIKLVAHLVLGWVVLSLIFEAPAGDALIAAAIVAILIYVVGDFLVASFVFAIGVGLFEYFFHNWLLGNVIPDERRVH